MAYKVTPEELLAFSDDIVKEIKSGYREETIISLLVVDLSVTRESAELFVKNIIKDMKNGVVRPFGGNVLVGKPNGPLIF
jgi:hypothetical protein